MKMYYYSLTNIEPKNVERLKKRKFELPSTGTKNVFSKSGAVGLLGFQSRRFLMADNRLKGLQR
jgi:hypothetical protein